jgi:NAD+ kinase
MTESPIRRVAVRGDDAVADALASTAVEVCGLGDAQAVVAVGEHAFTGAALSGSGTPLLPVDVGEGTRSVTRDDVADGASALRAGDYRAVSHPVLDVTIGGERVGRAVFDVTLMTSEPARISEYGVTCDGERLWTGRADGVVVASPLGSAGYARAAGGPIVVGEESLSVVPVSPFSTRADTWVVDGHLELTIERDEGDVSLFADDEELRRVEREHPVCISPTGGFTMLQPTVE